MRDPRFPTFRDHRSVCCFQCGELLDSHRAYASGYPTGFWAQYCGHCQMATYYDVEATAMPPDTRPHQRKALNPLAD
jgi:hypothetical protein